MKVLILILMLALAMATNVAYAKDITISIPDDKISDVVNAFCVVYNYEGRTLPDETKEQFTLRCIKQFVKEVYKSNKVNKAMEQTRQQAINNPENDLDIK